jgi:hypothetical protein
MRVSELVGGEDTTARLTGENARPLQPTRGGEPQSPANYRGGGCCGWPVIDVTAVSTVLST